MGDNTGKKRDAGKPAFALLDGTALRAIAEIMTVGAGVYGDYNWLGGFKWSRLFSALQRHMWAWWEGESLDPETQRTHLAHAGCCLMMLLAHELKSLGTDDRPSKKEVK